MSRADDRASSDESCFRTASRTTGLDPAGHRAIQVNLWYISVPASQIYSDIKVSLAYIRVATSTI